MSRVVVRAEQRITSHYGLRNGVSHNGVDIGYTLKEQENNIYANCKGTVIATVTGKGNTYGTSDHGYGNYVLIKHNNGYTSLYAHLQTVNVSVGQIVDENTNIGVMGNTGYSCGRHLHFEVRNASGIKINPEPYLTKSINEEVLQPVQDSIVKTVQVTLNSRYSANLVVDGIFGPATKGACVIVRQGHSGNITWLIQAMLNIKGYSTNGLDSIFGAGTTSAVKQFQKNSNIAIDGIVGKNTFEKLFV